MFGNRMKHCLVFASLISPSKMILFEKKYQTFDTVFHHQMKHLEVRQKYSATRRIFNSLLGVSSGDETLCLMFDILLPTLLNRTNWLLLVLYFQRNGQTVYKTVSFAGYVGVISGLKPVRIAFNLWETA